MPTVHFDSSWNFKLNCTCNIEIELEIQQGDKLNQRFQKSDTCILEFRGIKWVKPW